MNINYLNEDQEEVLTEMVERMYNKFKDLTCQVKCYSVEDNHALSVACTLVVIKGNHYRIDLLWRPSCLSLPSNRILALQRLESLKKKLILNPSVMKLYCQAIDVYVKKGYAEFVDRSQLTLDGGDWYLPHDLLLHSLKQDEVRVVLDCAS